MPSRLRSLSILWLNKDDQAFGYLGVYIILNERKRKRVCVWCRQLNNWNPNETTRNWTTHPSTKGFSVFDLFCHFRLSIASPLSLSLSLSVSVCLNEMRFLVAKPFSKYATSRANSQTNSSFFLLHLVILLNVWAWFCFFKWESTKIKNYSSNFKLIWQNVYKIFIRQAARPIENTYAYF